MNFYGMDLPVNAAVAAPNPNFSIPTLLMTLGILQEKTSRQLLTLTDDLSDD